MKILVVDDERPLVKGIKFNLENEGYEVDCCYDGAAAVEMAQKNNYHLIILDLMMSVLQFHQVQLMNLLWNSGFICIVIIQPILISKK